MNELESINRLSRETTIRKRRFITLIKRPSIFEVEVQSKIEKLIECL